jgi:hypothetical protein
VLVAYLTDAEADGWEQYAADAEVGARVRQADGVSFQAFKRGDSWPWPTNPNKFNVALHDAEGEYLCDLVVPTEELAEAVLAKLNGRAVAATPAPAPDTVDVPWLEALRDQREVQRDHPIRVCEMVNGEPRLSWVGGYTDGDWWGGAVRINPDGTVTVLADRADDTTAPSGDQS